MCLILSYISLDVFLYIVKHEIIPSNDEFQQIVEFHAIVIYVILLENTAYMCEKSWNINK